MTALLCSCLAGLTVYFNRGATLYLKIFPIFLFIIFLTESTSYYLIRQNKHTVSIYNISFIFEYCFYLFVLHEVIVSHLVKRIILAISLVFVLIALANILYLQKFENFNTYTVVLGCFLVVTLCMYYFIELFQRPKAINLLREPSFWICSGLIFFNFCSLPYFGLINYLSTKPYSLNIKLYYALQLLNLLLYSLFTIAFLCRIRIRKSL